MGMKHNEKNRWVRSLVATAAVAGLFAFGVSEVIPQTAFAQSGEIRIIDLSGSSSSSSSSSAPSPQRSQTQPSSAVSTPRINVRMAPHERYDRIVFDWGRAVSFTKEKTSSGETVTFNAPATLDLSGFNASRLSRVNAMRVEGTDPLKVTFDLNNAYLTTQKLTNRIVFDVYNEAPRLGADNVRQSDNQASSSPSSSGQTIKIVTGADAQLPRSRPSQQETPAPQVAEKPPVKTPPKSVPADRPTQTPAQQQVEMDAVRDQSALPTPSVNIPQTAEPGSREALIRQAQQRAAKDVKSSSQPMLKMNNVISVSSLKAIDLAVFKKDGFLWVVQSERQNGVPPVVSGNKDVKPLRVTDQKGISEAWLFAIPDNLYPQVSSNDFSWDITIDEEEIYDISSGIRTQKIDHNGTPKTALVINTGKPGVVLEFIDPHVGENVWVAPVSQDDTQISKPFLYPQFAFVPAAAGVAVKTFTPSVEMFYQDNDLIITDDNDLVVSSATSSVPVRFSQEAKKDSSRMFDLQNWAVENPEEFENNRRTFESQIAAQDDDMAKRSDVLNMINLYFANGFGAEALGLLRYAEQLDESLSDNPTFLALEGAVLSLAGRHDEALVKLTDGRIYDQPEMLLWKGYSLSQLGRWKEAYDAFAQTGNLLLEYPRNLQIRLARALAETAVNVKDPHNAQSLIDVMDKVENPTKQEQAAIAYLKGRLAQLNGETADAKRYLMTASNGADRYYRAKAAFDYLKLEQVTGDMDPERAAEVLERLRYIWRGDDFEINVMEYLGDFYLDNQEYRKGLEVLRSIIPLVEDDQEKTDEITQKLTDTFANLFVEDGGQDIPPLTALSLYNEFSELTPVGREGDRAIQKLAERMVEVDLLDRAAKLLEHQIKFRLQGIEATQVGTRLAAIRLLDNTPTLALEALEETKTEDMPEGLIEERQLLKARAFSQLGQPDEAIRILSGMNSPMAHRLNIDVNWKAGRWDAAASAIGPLLTYNLRKDDLIDEDGRVEILNAEASDLILNQAVAYTLAGDLGSVRVLSQRFGQAMAKTPNAALFQLITRAPKPGQLADLSTLQSHVGEVDMFSDFLNAYRGGGSPAVEDTSEDL